MREFVAKLGKAQRDASIVTRSANGLTASFATPGNALTVNNTLGTISATQTTTTSAAISRPPGIALLGMGDVNVVANIGTINGNDVDI